MDSCAHERGCQQSRRLPSTQCWGAPHRDPMGRACQQRMTRCGVSLAIPFHASHAWGVEGAGGWPAMVCTPFRETHLQADAQAPSRNTSKVGTRLGASTCLPGMERVGPSRLFRWCRSASTRRQVSRSDRGSALTNTEHCHPSGACTMVKIIGPRRLGRACPSELARTNTLLSSCGVDTLTHRRVTHK